MNAAMPTGNMSDTTISVPEELADELYRRKARGESYADVIRRLIEKAECTSAGTTGDESAVSQAESPTPRASDPSSRPATDATAATHTPDSERSLTDLIDDVADEMLPGSGAKLEARREALHAAVGYLREHGEATPADLQRDVYPDHQAEYTDGEDPANSWWKNSIYKGFDELADRADAVGRADTSGEWRWKGQ